LPSAKVSAIGGVEISGLTFLKENNKVYGRMTTNVDHGLSYLDNIEVFTSPESESQAAYQPNAFKVKVINGVETVVVNSIGIGYSQERLPKFRFFDETEDIVLTPGIDNNGNLTDVEVTKSGRIADLTSKDIKISIDPPITPFVSKFFSVQSKLDRLAEVTLPTGTLEFLKSNQTITNDIVLAQNEINSITTTAGDGSNGANVGQYIISVSTAEENLVQVGKVVKIVGFTQYTILNGNKTVTTADNNSFEFVVTTGATLPSTIATSTRDWNIVSSSSNGAHTMAIKQDGSLWGWGNNHFGQLGIGNRRRKRFPVQIGTATDWVEVSANGNKTHAIKSNGTMWSWGSNLYGETGLYNVKTARILTPQQVIFPGTAAGDALNTTWSKVAGGSQHSLATKTDGTLWSWGAGRWGGIGDGTRENKYSPVQVLDPEATEFGGTLTDGSAVVTNISDTSNIAVGDQIRSSSTGFPKETTAAGATKAILVLSKTADSITLNEEATATNTAFIGTFTADRDWTDLMAGSHYSAALKGTGGESGKAYVWGAAWAGRLGLGSIVYLYVFGRYTGSFDENDTITFEESGCTAKVASWRPQNRLLVLKNFQYGTDENGDKVSPIRKETIRGTASTTTYTYDTNVTTGTYEQRTYTIVFSGGAGNFTVGEQIFGNSNGSTAV